jgi:hypothetical protein
VYSLVHTVAKHFATKVFLMGQMQGRSLPVCFLVNAPLRSTALYSLDKAWIDWCIPSQQSSNSSYISHVLHRGAAKSITFLSIEQLLSLCPFFSVKSQMVFFSYHQTGSYFRDLSTYQSTWYMVHGTYSLQHGSGNYITTLKDTWFCTSTLNKS